MKKIIKIIMVMVLTFFFGSRVLALQTSFTDDFKGFSIDFDNALNRDKIFSYEYIPDGPETCTFFKISSNVLGYSFDYAEGRMLYCADGHKGSPSLDSGPAPFNKDCYIRSGSGSNDKSIAYVYEHGLGTYKTGYSATEYLTGDLRKDYYITQAAMWYFTIPPYFMSDFDFDAGTYKGQSNEVTKKISKLILDAKAAASGGSLDASVSNKKMSLTSDGKYYISDGIKLTGKFINSQITTTVSGNSSAFVVTDKNATSGSSKFNNNSTVYVKIPVESLKKDEAITLKVSATTSINDSEAIQCEHPQGAEHNVQPVIIFYPKNTTLSDSVSLTISVDDFNVMISKRDINNSEEIAGATLTIKNSKNEVIYTWVSDKTTKSVSLPSGTYILEETIAPDGYIKSTSTIEFAVDNSGKVLVGGKEVTEVIMTNDPIIVTISKRSITGSDELVGAKLKITDINGNIVKDVLGNDLEWVSGNISKSFHLKAGDYVLSETISPPGYELSESTIEFTVSSDGKVLVDGKDVQDNLIIFENVPEPKQVPTGSLLIYIASSLCIVSLGVLAYFIIKKRKNNV